MARLGINKRNGTVCLLAAFAAFLACFLFVLAPARADDAATGSDATGPALVSVTSTPKQIRSGESVTITVKASDSSGIKEATVVLSDGTSLTCTSQATDGSTLVATFKASSSTALGDRSVSSVTLTNNSSVSKTFTSDDFDASASSFRVSDSSQQSKYVTYEFEKELTYSGTRQTAVPEGAPYTVKNGSATLPGTYTATLSLKDKAVNVWDATGSADDVAVTWKILPETVTPDPINIGSGEQKFEVKVPEGTKSSQITWSLANTKIGTVESVLSGTSSTAVFTPTEEGTTTLSCTLDGTVIYTASITVLPARDFNAKITLAKDTYSYTGSAVTPEPTVTYNGRTLAKGTDYTLRYLNNVDVTSNAMVIVEGTGRYSGSNYVGFTIEPSSLSSFSDDKLTVTLDGKSANSEYLVYTLAGSAISPEPKLVLKTADSALTLAEGTDYTVSYENNMRAGKASVSITGRGNFKDTLTYYYTIKFSDVVSGAWYEDSVYNMSELGLMMGYGNSGVFGVGNTLTRAELVQILWRYANPNASSQFATINTTGMADVKPNMWYTAAANWAVAEGVVEGIPNADGSYSFAPDTPVTLEQMVKIFARLVGTESQFNTAPESILDYYVDGSRVSDWAKKYVAWSTGVGLISGIPLGNNAYELKPYENIARERAATIIDRAFAMGLME